jgi:starch-binding outer membrane protein SusE/F
MKKLSILLAAAVVLATGCKKIEFDDEPKGEALGPLKLVSPTTGAAVALNAATPNVQIDITWTAATPGVNTKPTYTWVAALKGGNIDAPILSIPSNNAGVDTKLTLTQTAIDAALAGKGIAAGAAVDLIWSVVADNKSVKVRSADVFGIKLTRFGDGATPFVLLAPLNSSLALPSVINPGSTSEITKFKWTKSFPKTGGAAVTYKILFAEKRLDANGNELPVNWASPLFSIVTDANGLTDSANISSKRLSDSLIAKGFTVLPTAVQLKWTVVATSGTWSQLSDYVNELVIVREVKVYIVGSATPGGWDISQSTRMIEDPRFPGTYFSYIRLTAGGNQIKFVNGQAFPPTPGAIDWGQDPALPAGNITDQGENNIDITTSGVYRVTFDLANKKYYLQTAVSNGIGGLGMIGSFQGWSQPATKMSYIGVNKAILLANMNTNDGFKFHDGNDWDNSANNRHRWFGLNSAQKLVVDGGGESDIKWPGSNGRVRTTFDGSDIYNLQYKQSPAQEMRVVGDGIQGVTAWTPGVSPTMTYSGNGVWTATLTLVAGKDIKFVSGNNWPDAANRFIDYEDASGGSTATGTPRSINEGGGPNFKTPATTGSYTITLNEYTHTVTIN